MVKLELYQWVDEKSPKRTFDRTAAMDAATPRCVRFGITLCYR